MKPANILEQVKQGADARFGETIERLLLTLRNRHTHQCWRKECGCEYCCFINGDYVSAKLALHGLKKRIRYYEDVWNLTTHEHRNMMTIDMMALQMKHRITLLKEHKKDLRENIV